MTSVPPLLPEEVLDRTQTLARRNGWSIVLVAGLAALSSAAQHDVINAVLALLAAGCGAMEIHGAGLLRLGEPRGTGWMIRGELLLLVVIVIYCSVRLLHPNLDELRAAFQLSLKVPGGEERWREIQQLGFTEEEWVLLLNKMVAITFAFVSFFYQGGMAICYAKRKRAIDLALGAE